MAAILNATDGISFINHGINTLYHSGVVGYGIYTMREIHTPSVFGLGGYEMLSWYICHIPRQPSGISNSIQKLYEMTNFI